jgi:hypothetical protein
MDARRCLRTSSPFASRQSLAHSFPIYEMPSSFGVGLSLVPGVWDSEFLTLPRLEIDFIMNTALFVETLQV